MRSFIIVLCFLVSIIAAAQEINYPVYAMISMHPLEVKKIDLSTDQTIVYLSIENQIDGGTFCADKNICIQEVSTHKKYKLVKSEGIPVCPDYYSFNSIGEVLEFKLVFPKLQSLPKYINLVEDCKQSCFYLKGIILDEQINKDISLAYKHYKNEDLDLAYHTFKTIIRNNPDYNFGFMHYSLIHILVEKNELIEARKWYNIILKSNFEDKAELLENIRTQSFYSQLN